MDPTFTYDNELYSFQNNLVRLKIPFNTDLNRKKKTSYRHRKVCKMLIKLNLRKANPRQMKKLLELRPIQHALNMRISQNAPQDSQDIFKFHNEDDTSSFCDKYRPLKDDDYNRFVSKRASKREPAFTRLITSLAYKVGKKMVSLAEGMPNEEVFPFNNLQLQLKNGSVMEIKGKELATALQYVPSQGLPSLLASLRDFQALLHRPPAHNRDVIITNGGQHGIYQCCELFVDPGDPVLISEYAFTGVQVALKPYDPEILSIPEDADGIRPEILEAMLASRLSRGLRMPKVLYTIPVGNNPTGTVITEERKRHIYELACKYDFLILEDDPYMFLNYTGKPVPSFLSLDSCGRVLRMDSLSKVVSSGLRAGWVTGPAPLVYRLELHAQAELLHSCSLAQGILSKLLEDRSALAAHLLSTREFYRARRDALHEALQAAKLQRVAEWNMPGAGLFLWMKVRGVDDVYNMAFNTALERGLMLIPGHAFVYDTSAATPYLRLTFSKCPTEQMEFAARLLYSLIQDEQRSSNTKRARNFATD